MKYVYKIISIHELVNRITPELYFIFLLLSVSYNVFLKNLVKIFESTFARISSDISCWQLREASAFHPLIDIIADFKATGI